MNTQMKQTLVTAVLMVSTVAAVWAGGWTQKSSEGYFKLGQSAIVTNTFWGPGGEFIDTRTLGNYNSSFYGEYGLSKRFTAIGFFPFYVRNTLNETKGERSGRVLEPGATNENIGDLDLALKYGINQEGPLVLSATFLVGVPTGDTDHEFGLFTGDGEWNQLLKLEAGYALGDRSYLSGYLGANNRTGGFSDEVRYGVEFGHQFGRVWALFKVDGIESMENGADDTQGGSMGLFANNVEFLSLGPELVYEVKNKWGFTASAFGALKGQNVLASPSFNVGVFWKLKPKSDV